MLLLRELRFGYALKLFVLWSVLFGGFAKAELRDLSQGTLQQFERGVKKFELENGLRVLFYPRRQTPVFSGVVSVRVGGSDEVPGETGISHLLEHMAFKGTSEYGVTNARRERVLLAELESLISNNPDPEKFDPEDRARWEAIQSELSELWVTSEFTQAYDLQGAVGLNATTSKELTNYFVSLPSEAFEFWCEIEAQRVLDPVMRQFYKERDVVLEERRMRYEDQPNGKLYETMLGVAYLMHPYRNPVIGYEADIRRLTATRTREFHRRYYVPGNMVVSLVGDLDYDQVRETVTRYFSALPPAPVPPRPAIVEPEQIGEREVTLELDAAPLLFVGYRKPSYPHPDDPAITAMEHLLGGGRIAPLYKQLVKEKRLATTVGVQEVPGNVYPNLILFYLEARQPTTNQRLLKELDLILEKFKRSDPDPDHLAIAKRKEARAFIEGLRSNLSLARELASAELIYGDWRVVMKWFDEFMAVTTEDVQRVARMYLNNRSRTVARIESAGKSK